MDYILTTDRLCKNYRFRALDELSCVKRYNVWICREKSWKTTLMRLICGLQKTDVRNLYAVWDETDGIRGSQRPRMGAVVESPSIYLDMTAEESERTIPNSWNAILGRKLGVAGTGGIANTGKKKAKNIRSACVKGLELQLCLLEIQIYL